MLYAAGSFTFAGGIAARHIAAWDGTQWSPLGSGVQTRVNALAVNEASVPPILYAAGGFTQAGGQSANYVAQWDGSQWSPLGSGLGDWAQALCVYDDGSGVPELYVGGDFTTAGNQSANFVARWDGSQWHALGSGTFGGVYAFASFDDGSGPDLYVGGAFTEAGGQPITFVARWDGSSWSNVGGGTDGTVDAMAVFDDGSGPALYVGGVFTTAGGQPANHIAKWDGSSWSSVGSGLNDVCRDLAVFDDGTGPALYAAGHFTSAGGQPASYIAKWNGTTWSALDAGTDSHVYALASNADGDPTPTLHVGGGFASAGNLPAEKIADWRGCAPDTDGDGLLDSWEAEGLDIDGDGILELDLPAMGADPLRKDLFVEVDVMAGVPLDPGAIDDVVTSFDIAPVDNPDGSFGITLHIDLATADSFPFEQEWDDDFVAYGAIKSVFFGTEDERQQPNWPRIREARQRVFRYCTIVNAFEGGALGWGENPGNDFMCAFGGSAADDRHLQASTFMHELGHNLGLGHGGAYVEGDEVLPDEVNYKPNYVSVMNYGFDLYEYDIGGRLFIDYSREVMLPLIEDNLDETIGISSDAYSDVLVFHGYRHPGEPPEIGWVQLDVPSYDWNHDGQQEPGVVVDLNWLGDGYPGGSNFSPGETMHGRNDWDVIVLPIGDSGAYGAGQHIPPPFEELTEEGLAFLRQNIPPPPIRCPADLDGDGDADVNDFFAYLDLFAAGDPDADINGDGSVDVNDFFAYLDLFAAGC